MTINELRNAVKVELDKTSSLDLPAFETEEIDYWLTLALKRFREDRYNKYMSGDSSIKLQEEFGNQYIHAKNYGGGSILAVSGIGEGKLYTLEITIAGTYDDILYYTNSLLTEMYVQSVNKTLSDGSVIASYWQKCKHVSEAEMGNYLSAPNKYRYFEEPVYYKESFYDEGAGAMTLTFKVCTDYYTSSIGTTVKLSMLPPVKEINSTNFPLGTEDYSSYMPLHTQHNIVNLAVMLMLENIESQRLQTNVAVINKEE